MSILGSNSADFRLLSSNSLSIAPGNSDSIELEFTASARGTKEAELVIQSNDSQNDPYHLNLRGTCLNSPPNVNPIPDQIHYSENEWVFKVPAGTFIDPDGDSLSYSTSSLPDWMSFDPQTQIFRGTPDKSQDGMSYDVNVAVDDERGGTASDVFKLTLRMVIAKPPPIIYF